MVLGRRVRNYLKWAGIQILIFQAVLEFVTIHINPIHLEWVPIWHPLSFLLYLRHGFCSESEDVKGNRVKHDLIERIHKYLAHIYIINPANLSAKYDFVWQ